MNKKPIESSLMRNIYHKSKTGLIIISVGLFFFSPRIIDGLTPADKLAHEIYEDSSYEERIGAKCRDGWDSRATGRGACSHHGGVREWKYEKKYRKSYSESKREALKKSWID